MTDSIIQSIEDILPKLQLSSSHSSSSSRRKSHSHNDTKNKRHRQRISRRRHADRETTTPTPTSTPTPTPTPNSTHGLEHISERELREILEPVRQSLEDLDAELLLSLIRCRHGLAGATLEYGTNVEPIHDKIRPPNEGMRYLPVAEVQARYTIGMFIFPPYARIPLHDHPGMVVLSRILYGDLKVKAFDILPNEEQQERSSVTLDKPPVPDAGEPSTSGTGWAATLLNKLSIRPLLPNHDRPSPPPLPSTNTKGALRAIEHELTTLTAPKISVLYPYRGNAHEFTAGEYGAAVLDVLMPPYKSEDNRDCTFYRKEEVTNGGRWYQRRQQEEEVRERGLPVCSLVPIHMPNDFSCISGSYGMWGSGDVDEEDDYE